MKVYCHFTLIQVTRFKINNVFFHVSTNIICPGAGDVNPNKHYYNLLEVPLGCLRVLISIL